MHILNFVGENTFANIGKLSFIVLLYRHIKFGWIADLWMAEPYREILLKLLIRCTKANLADAGDDLSGNYLKIVETAGSFSDQELARMFAPKGDSVTTFLQIANDDLISRHIRPFMDRKLNEIMVVATKARIPVYLRHEGTVLMPTMKLTPVDSFAEPWFCFSKGADGSRYILEVTVNEEPLDLRMKETTVLTENPCLLIHNGRLIRFRDGFEGKKLNPFLTKEYILIPAATEKKYFETFILKTLKTGQVKAEGFTVHESASSRAAELSLEIDWQGKVVLIIHYRYGKYRIMRGKKQLVFTELKLVDDTYTFYRLTRDLKWENEIHAGISKLGLRQINESVFGLPKETGITANDLFMMIEWINQNRNAINSLSINIVQDGFNFHLGTVSANIEVIGSDDWFDVQAVVKFGDLEIPFNQLRKYILDGIREFPLPGGEIAVLPAEWFIRYHDLLAYSKNQKDRLRISARHFTILAAMDYAVSSSVADRLRNLEFEPVEQSLIPPGFSGALRPYQSDGLQWLKFLNKHRFGGCLADDMGLGKTIQTLALMLTVRNESKSASLIVMPASLIHNWRNEIARFAPSLKVMIHAGQLRTKNSDFFDSADIILTTYGICRNDIDILQKYRFHYIILDESQIIKNPEAQISRTVYSLNSVHKLALTGTPIENSLTDLWSQMEFLNPGLLVSLTDFKRIYINSFDPARDEQKVERLRKLVAPFILRRRKIEVEPDLPELSIEYRYCDMTDSQQRLYEIEKSAVRNEILSGIENGSIQTNSVQVLKALIRLRQIACHPLLIDREYEGESGKLDEVIRNLEILKEENQKVLIFSSFVEHLKIVAQQFTKNSWSFSMLTGSTQNRESVINGFKEAADNNFFLISLKAGGTGLNLTQAGYVFMLDPWWNPMSELNAISRAHRIGQDKKVIAYKFISKDTIEEKMLILQQRKQILSDTFIPVGNPLKGVTPEEAAGLFY